MHIEEADAILKRCTYRPGWKLELSGAAEGYRPDDYTVHLDSTYSLVVTANVEDTYNPGRLTPIGSIFPLRGLEFLETPEEFMRLVQRALWRHEEHESQEWLKIDGKIYDDPHTTNPPEVPPQPPAPPYREGMMMPQYNGRAYQPNLSSYYKDTTRPISGTSDHDRFIADKGSPCWCAETVAGPTHYLKREGADEQAMG
jgi:hypothetical protein